MINSFYREITEKFSGILVKVAEKERTEGKELFRTMLTEEFSPNMQWGSADISNSVTVADVVALDSSLPLKARNSITLAKGDIPKIGIAYKLTEKEINNISLMQTAGVGQAEIVKKVFGDGVKVIKAIDQRIELAFLQGLSAGATLISGDNMKTGVRADFGYKESNTLKAKGKKWSEATAKPISDLNRIFDKVRADGNAVAHVYLDRNTFANIRKSAEAKELVLASVNAGIDKSNAPLPSRQSLLNALEEEFGAVFHVVDGTFNVQKADGTTESVKAWEEGSVILTPSDKVGRLVYGRLAEETHQVAEVTYTKAGNYTLVSKYAEPNPLQEFTLGQALVLPVIDGVSQIYKIKTEETE